MFKGPPNKTPSQMLAAGSRAAYFHATENDVGHVALLGTMPRYAAEAGLNHVCATFNARISTCFLGKDQAQASPSSAK